MRSLLGRVSDNENVRVGTILQALGVQGFAFLILTLSLLNIFIFMVPFLSLLFGIPMIILSGQMVVGLHTPIFPRLIRYRTIPSPIVVKGLNQTIHGMEKIERYIKPRLSFLSSPRLERFHGMTALILSIMVSIPIPFFNIPPSLALALLAIGLLERDGFFIVLAYSLGFWCLILFKSLGHIAHALT